MAHLPWVDFLGTHPTAHLVAAVIVPARSASHLLRLRRLMQHLIEDQQPAGDYATAIVRPTEIAHIHCGFADKADADRFAMVAKAQRTKPRDEWRSRCCFRLDAEKEIALAGVLARRKSRRSGRPADCRPPVA